MNPFNKILAGALVACAATPFATGVAHAQTYRNDYAQGYENRQAADLGVVQAVEVVKGTNQGNRIGGALLGGVIGGVLGHQLGSGRGNDVATVAGALGGAAVGNGIARDKGTQDSYRVTVRMDSGDTQVFEQGSVGGLRSGDRVRVDGGVVSLYAANAYQSYPQGALPPPPDAYSPDDRAVYQDDDRYRREGPRVDDRGYRYDRDGNRIDDRPTYRDNGHDSGGDRFNDNAYRN